MDTTVVRVRGSKCAHARALRIWRPRGLTMIETLVIVLVLTIGVAFAMPLLFPRRGCGARQLRDSAQIRGIMQSLVLWASSNGGLYPLPSELDKANATIADSGEGSAFRKDLPRHILSTLIFSGFIPVELMVSPAEANGNVQVCTGYRFDMPPGVPSEPDSVALWDAAFRATPRDRGAGPGDVDGMPGNCSYATLPPFGKRRSQWGTNAGATLAILGNRGPVFTAKGSGASQQWSLLDHDEGDDTGFGAQSQTLLIHGGRNTWEGNIAFNDGSVRFVSRSDPADLTYTFSALPSQRRTQPDNLFVNESDRDRSRRSERLGGGDNDNSNAYLRPYAVVGGESAQTATLDVPWFD